MIEFSLLKDSKPIYKLISFLLIFIGFSIVIPIFLMLVGIVIWGRDAVLGGFSAQTPLSYLIFFQLLTQIGVFAGAALFFARLNSSSVFSFLQVKNVRWSGYFLLSVLAMVFVIPLASWLLEVSLSFSFPPSMKGFIDAVKQQEEAGNILMKRFLNVDGWGWLLFNLFFLALVPAVCEELLFRGALMTILQQMIRNKHVVVLVCAVVFSAIHFQFFSFFSRVVLGLVLGYATLYSGSLLPAIAAHFANNAISVIGYYFSDRKELNEIGAIDNLWVMVLTTVLAVTMMVIMHKKSSRYAILE